MIRKEELSLNKIREEREKTAIAESKLSFKINGFLKLLPIKLKQLFCKHEWEYLENREWNPDITHCLKCDKVIFDDSKFNKPL